MDSLELFDCRNNQKVLVNEQAIANPNIDF